MNARLSAEGDLRFAPPLRSLTFSIKKNDLTPNGVQQFVTSLPEVGYLSTILNLSDQPKRGNREIRKLFKPHWGTTISRV